MLESTPSGWCVSGPVNAWKSPCSFALIVTDNQSEGRWGRLDPARVVCLWAWKRSKKPLELSSHPDRQPERGVLCWNLPRRGDAFLGLSTHEKAPCSLALIVTDNQSEGRWGRLDPARVVCLWAWKRSKKPLQLSSHPDRQPERGALGQTRPRQGSVSLGLKTLEKAPAA